MKNLYDELWKLPEDTLSLSSDTEITPVTSDAVTEDMNYLKNDGEDVNYSEIKYEEVTDMSQILESNIDYKRYELSESDRVLKENVRYISLKYICRYLNRTSEWVEDRQILHNLFFMIDSNGDKLFREDDVVSRMKYLGIEFRRTDLPYSQFNREEAAEYMGISQEDFERIAPGIPCKEDETSDGEKYSIFYRKDLDVAYRHNYFLNILSKSSESIHPKDICHILDIHGKDYENFKKKYPLAVRRSHDTRRSLRHCSADVKGYIDEHKNDKSIYKPLPKFISADMSRIYCGAHRIEWLRALYTDRVLKPVRDANGKRITMGAMSMFSVDDLDDYIYHRECDDLYGLGREFITRKHIKNRYGVSNEWIDTYVKNSENVRIMLSNKEIIPWSNISKFNTPVIITGINYSDVEKLIKDGHYIDITREYVIKRLKIDKEENKKKYKQAKNAIFFSHMAYVKAHRKSPFAMNTVDSDSIALSIESKINEERLILDEKKRLAEKISRERYAMDNNMRNILGLTEKRCISPSTNACVLDMDSPQIFMCINKRGDCNLWKNFKLAFNIYTYTFSIKRYFTFTSKEKKSISMKAFCSGMNNLIQQEFRVAPSWFVFMDSTTYITDMFFKDKLESLPSEVGVVGTYGWKTLPSSYNWHESDSSYGFYDTYSIKNNTTKKVVGKAGFGEVTEVSIVGGPVLAIRVSLIYDLLRKKYLHGYRVGDDHIGAVLSAYASMCRRKVCVMDTSCIACSDYSDYVGGEEWNDDQIQFVMSWDKQLRSIIKWQNKGRLEDEGVDNVQTE